MIDSIIEDHLNEEAKKNRFPTYHKARMDLFKNGKIYICRAGTYDIIHSSVADEIGVFTFPLTIEALKASYSSYEREIKIEIRSHNDFLYLTVDNIAI